MFSLCCLNSPFMYANERYCNVPVETYLQSSDSSQVIGILYREVSPCLEKAALTCFSSFASKTGSG